jgi:hypothetical protein
MMNGLRFLVLIFVFGMSYCVYGQELNWIYKIGGLNMEYGTAVTIDGEQNVYDATVFTGTPIVNNNLMLSSRGGEDILLRKSSNLGIIQWTRTISSRFQDIAYDVVNDNAGNVYIVGTFEDSLFYQNQFVVKGPSTRVSSFIMKINEDGTRLWTKILESTVAVEARSITATTNAEVIITGHFQGETNFESGQVPITIGSKGGSDIFVLKVNGLTGITSWVKTMGGIDQDYVAQHTRDAQGNILITGEFRQIVDFDPDVPVANQTSKGQSDIFVLKLNNMGTYQWVKTYGSVGIDGGHTLSTDSELNVIVSGRYSESVSFGLLGNQIRTAKGGTDVFLMKMDQSGKTTWINSYGDTSNDAGVSLKTNETGIIFLGGVFRGKVDFDLDPVGMAEELSAGAQDIFVLTLNQDGTLNEHYILGGVANDQLGEIALRFSGDIIQVGGFGAIVDFDPSVSETNIISSGGLDAFMANIYECVNPYIKTLTATKTVVCKGDKVLINIAEGFLNGATQWSWERDSCTALAFSTGTFIEQTITRNINYFVKGSGGCVVNGICKSVAIKAFTDSLNYQSIRLCSGDSLKVGNKVYKTAGVYVDSLTAGPGCDSIVVSEVTVFPRYSRTNQYNICEGDTVRVGSSFYTLPGTYTDTYTSINGCDSLIISQVSIIPITIENQQATICDGKSIRINNVVYDKAGTYIQTSTLPNGCEKQTIIRIAVVQTQFFVTRNLCEGDIYRVGSNVYTKSGVYVDTFLSVNGCDSIIFSDLTFLKSKEVEFNYEICNGSQIKIGNSIYTKTGNYIDTLVRKNGCDSIVFTNIRVINPPAPVTYTYQLCEGSVIKVGNSTYFMNGTYKDTILAVNGCDSIVTSIIIVNPKYYNIDRTICQGDSVVIGNSTYKSSGLYSKTLINRNGCDSTIVLSLKVNNTIRQSYNFSLCPGDSIVTSHRTFKEAGVYLDTLTAKSGCDSILTTTIRLNNKQQILNYELCQGETVTIAGVKYESAGNFSDTLQTVQGCDSVLLISIKYNPTFTRTLVFDLCQGQSVTIGSGTYSNPGTYIEVLKTIKGCDSIINFTVLVVTFVPSFVKSVDTLIAPDLLGASYQWYECINGEPIQILGATKRKHIISKSGSYALGITFLGCTYISSCQTITLSSTDEPVIASISVHPNPVDHVLTVTSEVSAEITIVDIHGRSVYKGRIEAGNNFVNVSDWPVQTYIISLLNKGNGKHIRFVKR